MVPSSPMCGNIPIGSMWSKNPRYWQSDEVSLREIELYMIAPDMELAMFENHKLDWAGSPLSTITADAVQSLKAPIKLQIRPLLRTTFSASTHRSGFRIRKTLSKVLFFEKLSHLLLTGKPLRSTSCKGAYEKLWL